MLKCRATHSGTDPQQSGSGMQFSSTDLAGLNPPPKRIRVDEEEVNSDEEAENFDMSQGLFVPISEAAAAFLEASFNMKLDNNAWKAKAKVNGMPNSRWIQCAKLDSVVSANVLVATRLADRVSSRIQNFWLDVATPLIFFLEKAEELELPAEEISGMQTSLQLMVNANYQHSVD